MELTARFLGPATIGGRLDAVQVGPAIFGMGSAVGQAARVLYGDHTEVRVEVRADFRHASFGIDFLAVGHGVGMLGPISAEQLQNIANVIGIVVGGGGGVIGLCRWLAGRRIQSVQPNPARNTVTITAEENAHVTVSIQEYTVFADRKFREGLESLVAPLDQDGVEALELGQPGREPMRISREERGSFKSISLPDEQVSDDTSTAILEIVSPVFRDDHSWKFAQGDVVFWAKIDDQVFLDRVAEHRTTFGRGDALRVEMLTQTTRGSSGQLKYQRTITRVIEELKGNYGEQSSLL